MLDGNGMIMMLDKGKKIDGLCYKVYGIRFPKPYTLYHVFWNVQGRALL